MKTRSEQKDSAFLLIAQTLGVLGTCPRKAVGAVLTYHGRAISWGFNGAPPGLPHCEENLHGWRGDKGAIPFISEKERRWHKTEPGVYIFTDEGWEAGAQAAVEQFGCRNATHAEANALAFAARQGISTDDGTCYVTVSPCETCARLLLAAGIARVVYAEEYRDPAGVELLREAGVQIG